MRVISSAIYKVSFSSPQGGDEFCYVVSDGPEGALLLGRNLDAGNRRSLQGVQFFSNVFVEDLR